MARYFVRRCLFARYPATAKPTAIRGGNAARSGAGGGGGTLGRPPDGATFSPKPNTRMNRIPYPHGGTTNVVRERTVIPRSKGERASLAIHNPSQMPPTAATTFATVNNTKLLGSLSKMIAETAGEPSDE